MNECIADEWISLGWDGPSPKFPIPGRSSGRWESNWVSASEPLSRFSPPRPRQMSFTAALAGSSSTGQALSFPLQRPYAPRIGCELRYFRHRDRSDGKGGGGETKGKVSGFYVTRNRRLYIPASLFKPFACKKITRNPNPVIPDPHFPANCIGRTGREAVLALSQRAQKQNADWSFLKPKERTEVLFQIFYYYSSNNNIAVIGDRRGKVGWG